MKKLKGYIPFHFLISLILGILFQYFLKFWNYNLYLLIGISFICFFILYLQKKSREKYTLASWIFFFFIGICITYVRDPKNHSSYLKKTIHNNSLVQAKVYKILKPSKNYFKYFASIYFVNDKASSGNILVSIKKDSINNNDIIIEDVLLFKNNIQNIPSPQNPHQFNYKNYLGNQYVYHQIHLSKHNFIKIKNDKNSIIGLVSKLKNHIKERLTTLNFKPNELAIINALLLGDKNDINPELKDHYSKAGAIHILAISGLHIGIILILFSKLLSPLEYFKKGENIKTFLLVIILWLFAILTGLSASVVRATTMFSFIAIGNFIQKTKVIEHSLISSMLFLLLIQPLYIFDIGFQLSYLAVFGIVWIQPTLQKLVNSKNYVINKIWQLITVSISAQIAVLPLSIYYFHQFPGLFIISNLFIIPFLGLILSFGILIIVLSLFNSTPDFLVFCYGKTIRLMNFIIEWIANKESFIINKLHLSFLTMLGSYLLIISVYNTLLYKKTKWILFSLSLIIFIQCIFIFEKKDRFFNNEFIVFHQYKNSLIGIRKGNYLFTDTTRLKIKYSPILPYEINEQIIVKNDSVSKNVYQFKNYTILKVDSTAIYEIERIKDAIVILSNNPKINLERLILKLKPHQIIADGSNYKSNCELWEQTCKQQKTPFHQTRQNGAYTLK